MKKINNAFIATDKDGSIDEILKNLPHNEAGYSAIFSDVPLKDIEKMLKMFPGIDEDLNPAMANPLSFFYILTPNEVADALIDKNTACQRKFELFINQSIDLLTHWLENNREMLNELIAYCEGVYIEDLDNNMFKVNNYKATAAMEKSFIEDSIDNKDKMKRTKLLAALDALCQHQDMLAAAEKNLTSDTMILMFFFTRSLAQFCAQRTVIDGLNLQKGRRNQKPVQKPGFIALKKSFKEKYPNSSESMLWKLIKRDLNSKPFIHKEYTVEYHPEVTDTKITSGYLIQINEEGKEYTLQFEAFRKIKF